MISIPVANRAPAGSEKYIVTTEFLWVQKPAFVQLCRLTTMRFDWTLLRETRFCRKAGVDRQCAGGVGAGAGARPQQKFLPAGGVAVSVTLVPAA